MLVLIMNSILYIYLKKEMVIFKRVMLEIKWVSLNYINMLKNKWYYI